MRPSLIERLRERGVFRVAMSYGVIAWLVLQIASVVFEPLGVPRWVMVALIATAAVGFPVAILLAWFFEITPQGVVLDTQPEGAARPHATGLRRYADVLIISLLLAIIAVLLLRDRPWESPPLSIAVLPFHDTSPLPEQGYFSDGFSEALLDQLARVPGLRVAARGSSFTVRDREADPKLVAARLGVGNLLVGKVGRAGGRIVLSAELIGGNAGARVWSGDFERPASEVFALQKEVLAQVLGKLLPGTELSSAVAPPAQNLGAWDLYLVGRQAQTRRSREYVEKSVGLFEQAIALDPNYALAYTGLANSLLLIGGWSGFKAETTAPLLARADAAIRRALEIDPQLSEAHGAFATFLRISGKDTWEEEYKRAIELNPNNAIALHDYAVALGSKGRPQESMRMEERALEIDPLHVAANWNRIALYWVAGDRDGYARAADAALARFADDPGALERFSDHFLNHYGDIERAMRAARRWMQITPPDQPRFAALFVASAYGFLGDVDAGKRMLDFAAAGPRAADLDRAVASERSYALAAEGRYDEALALLDTLPDYLCWAPANTAADVERDRHAVRAYFVALQGRDAELIPHLDAAEPLLERHHGGPLGCDIAELTPAVLPVLRRLGQAERADALSASVRTYYTTALKADPTNAVVLGGLAQLEAAEGHRAAAVSLLKRLSKAVVFLDPYYFLLPWIAALHGEPGYDDLLAAHERKRKDILARLAATENGSR